MSVEDAKKKAAYAAVDDYVKVCYFYTIFTPNELVFTLYVE